METRILTKLPKTEKIAISYIGKRFNFDVASEEFSHCVITGNNAGYTCEIIYKSLDATKIDFRIVDGVRVREFSGVLSLNGIRPYGIKITYLDDLPIISELYSFDIELPKEIKNVFVEDIHIGSL